MQASLGGGRGRPGARGPRAGLWRLEGEGGSSLRESGGPNDEFRRAPRPRQWVAQWERRLPTERAFDHILAVTAREALLALRAASAATTESVTLALPCFSAFVSAAIAFFESFTLIVTFLLAEALAERFPRVIAFLPLPTLAT